MKSKSVITLIFATVIVALGMVYLGIGKSVTKNDVKLLNAEFLAETENLGGGYYTNFSMQTVWYTSGGSVSLTEPFISLGWSTMDCCVNSTDANACDFSKEDSNCASKITRASRN